MSGTHLNRHHRHHQGPNPWQPHGSTPARLGAATIAALIVLSFLVGAALVVVFG